jgi:two-component system, response regulator
MTIPGKLIVILMAEDDDEDKMLARDALEEARVKNPLETVSNGEELMDYLNRKGKFSDPKSSPVPGIILLDLNMPKKDGREALREIKANPELRRIPVIIMTTSSAEEDILRSYDLGVSGYISKPVTFEGLVEVMRSLKRYWLEIVELPQGDD